MPISKIEQQGIQRGPPVTHPHELYWTSHFQLTPPLAALTLVPGSLILSPYLLVLGMIFRARPIMGQRVEAGRGSQGQDE